MRIYQKHNQLTILFESNPNVHVSVLLGQDPYIEYIKKQYPQCLLEEHLEVQFSHLDPNVQTQLKTYFDSSRTKALVKSSIFTEAVQQLN